MSFPDDAVTETMADDIWAAMEPLRYYHDNYDPDMDFDKYHERAEINLMKVLDKWYSAGFKDGVADEKASWEYGPIIQGFVNAADRSE
jgi:hypothetical protein